MTILKRGPYSVEEDALIKIHYPTKGAIWCADYIGRSSNSVSNRVHCLGVRMTPEAKRQAKIDARKKPNNWYKVNPDQFFSIQKPAAAYFLGFLWADGYVKIPKRAGGGNYILALNISKLDFEALGNVFDSLGKWGVYKVNKTKRHRIETVCVRTGNKPLVEFLVHNDYSIKSIAAPVKILSRIPEHLKHYFWRGYFDGDGTLTCKKRNYVFAFSGDYRTDWTEHMSLLSSLDIKCNLSKSIRSTGSYSAIHAYNVSNVVRFGGYIYEGYLQDQMGLKRKWEKYNVAKQVSLICDRIDNLRFSEAPDFIKTREDFLELVAKYPESVSRKNVLGYFDITQGSFDHIVYRLRQEGKISASSGKCRFYTIL